jgi:PAS domain S-box-containing protein
MPGLGVVILDGMLTIQFADGPLFDGTSVRDLVGRPFAEALPRTEFEQHLQMCRKALEGELCVLEREATKDHGTYLTEFVPLRNHEGDVTGVMAVTHDLSLQMRATRAQKAVERAMEAERRAADDRFEQAFGHAPSGIAMIEPGACGRITMVNHTLCHMLGYTEEELRTKTELDLTHPEDIEESTAAIGAIESGVIDRWSRDQRLVAKDGSTVWVTASIAPLRGDDGTLLCRVVHLLDVSERMRARLERELTARRFGAAFTGSPIGMGLVDRSGRWQRVNAAMCRMFGHDEPTMLTMSAEDSLSAEEIAEFLKASKAILRGERDAFEIEAPIIRGDGNEVHLSIVVTGVREDDGSISGYVVQTQDVTDRLRHERALRDSEHAAAIARDRAVEASELKSRFVAGVSHELRTPLSGVLGMLELLEETDGLTAEQASLLASARSAADVLLAVINDVLDLSKAEHGKMTISSAPVHIDRLLDELRATFTYDCTTKGITFLTGRESAVPSVIVGDPTRLRQVLLNLAGNAVKFTDRGSVTVRVLVDPENETQLRFEVEDTGIGIPDDELQRLFEPFHQVDSSITKRHGGTGLGLSIAKELVALMDGELGVTSTQSAGSKFWFTAPLTEYRPVDALQLPGDLPVGPEARSRIDGAGKRVLVVEDNAVNQQLAVLRLQRHGFDVDVAENGREAVELAERGAYDLILMDCYMPVLDGFSATDQIREAEREGRHTPILAMTAGALDSDRERCVEVGMDDLLVKPVRQLDLDAALQRWIN